MLFTELPFFALIATTFTLYYLPIIRSHQVLVLLVASFVFYGYREPYLLSLLAISALLNGVCGYLVPRTSRFSALAIAGTGVTLNLAILIFFKYAKLIFTTVTGTSVAQASIAEFVVNLPLPIGISFFTFHGISLLLDVWHNRMPPKSDGIISHVMNTALYICFFPQLVAGPITKARNFYPQIRQKLFREIDWEYSLQCLLVGYFLKLVVANNLGNYTFLMQYPYYIDQPSINLVILIFAYSIQIFADFAGYSLIALGVATLFGYRLPVNFNFPYISQSFSEFWKRWHISLSSWLRDYLYFPLGGSRVGELRTYLNLIIVMGLGGLWHGAAWSYAIWGLAHGVALAIERPFRNSWFYRTSLPPVVVIRVAIVFLFVTSAWVLFRLPNIDQAAQYFLAIRDHGGWSINWLVVSILIFAAPAAIYHAAYVLRGVKPMHLLRYPANGAMLALMMLNSGPDQPFIYFQF